MLNLRMWAISAVFLFLLVFAASAQSGRIVGIDSGAFYVDKTGINALTKANAQLEAEFGVRAKEISDGNTKLQSIATEIARLQQLPASAANNTTIKNKQDEGSVLQRALTYKRDDLQAAIEKRRQVLFNPILDDIGKALEEFRAKGGYVMVLDLSKMAESQALLYIAEGDILTTQFIAFYNARPPAPATATATK